MMPKIQPEMKEIQKKFKETGKATARPSRSCSQAQLQSARRLPAVVDPDCRSSWVCIGPCRSTSSCATPPLLSHAIRWCSNLAAPDMLYDWSWFMPDAVNNGVGFLFPLSGDVRMGPYLNLFPIITLVLFLVQQKVMMPPAADEQAAQQQKIMKYVMFLMGLMFFKVAAGLCIYFIASTFWGLAERRFLPKPRLQTAIWRGRRAQSPTPKLDRPAMPSARPFAAERGEEVAGRRLAQVISSQGRSPIPATR